MESVPEENSLATADAASNEADPVTRTVRVVTNIDDNGNNLMDINTIDDLDAMRNNLRGNQMRCGADGATACEGYELLQNLDFTNATHYASGTVNTEWRPNNTNPDMATNPGWKPIGTFAFVARFSTRFNGNGFEISNLYVRRGGAVGLFGYNIGILDGVGIVNARLYGGGRKR